jgi:hypothetical protein
VRRNSSRLTIRGLVLLLLALRLPGADSPSELAVVVNKTIRISSLSSRDLRSIFLGTRDSWPDGMKLTAVSLPVTRAETRTVLKEVCGMSDVDFKRYFLLMNFQGKSVSPPRMMQSVTGIKSYVSSTPGALGVIPARDVDSSVAVMSIDGLKPGSPGYRLSMAQ